MSSCEGGRGRIGSTVTEGCKQGKFRDESACVPLLVLPLLSPCERFYTYSLLGALTYGVEGVGMPTGQSSYACVVERVY